MIVVIATDKNTERQPDKRKTQESEYDEPRKALLRQEMKREDQGNGESEYTNCFV